MRAATAAVLTEDLAKLPSGEADVSGPMWASRCGGTASEEIVDLGGGMAPVAGTSAHARGARQPRARGSKLANDANTPSSVLNMQAGM